LHRVGVSTNEEVVALNEAEGKAGRRPVIGIDETCVGVVYDKEQALEKVLRETCRQQKLEFRQENIAKIMDGIDKDFGACCQFWAKVAEQGHGQAIECNTRCSVLPGMMGIWGLRVRIHCFKTSQEELQKIIADKKAGEHAAKEDSYMTRLASVSSLYRELSNSRKTFANMTVEERLTAMRTHYQTGANKEGRFMVNRSAFNTSFASFFRTSHFAIVSYNLCQ